MIHFKTAIPCVMLAILLAGCGGANDKNAAAPESPYKTANAGMAATEGAFETLQWEDLMPEGEDERLEKLYTDFYEEQENRYREQMTLTEAAKVQAEAEATGDIMSLITEGSAQDTMEQIGTYNVVADLDGAKVRLPGYVVPLDFNAASEYTEFLLVPYFGACLHTPPPPPNQIVFISSKTPTKIADIYEPVWVEGTMKTGKFGSDLGNSAYELSLASLEPYDY